MLIGALQILEQIKLPTFCLCIECLSQLRNLKLLSLRKVCPPDYFVSSQQKLHFNLKTQTFFGSARTGAPVVQ